MDLVLTTRFAFEAFSLEARILENAASFRAQLDPIINDFNPDIIHCNDRQTYLPFRFNKNVFYSSHLLYCDMLSMQALDDVYFQEFKIERCALSCSVSVAVYSSFAAKRVSKLLPYACSPIILPLGLILFVLSLIKIQTRCVLLFLVVLRICKREWCILLMR